MQLLLKSPRKRSHSIIDLNLWIQNDKCAFKSDVRVSNRDICIIVLLVNDAVLPYKLAKRQYLGTLQVRKYCLLDLDQCGPNVLLFTSTENGY